MPASTVKNVKFNRLIKVTDPQFNVFLCQDFIQFHLESSLVKSLVLNSTIHINSFH